MVLSKNSPVCSSTWVCPSDRNLTLRAKLNSGWSSRSSASTAHYLLQQKITAREMGRIQQVLKRAAALNCTEKQRISAMMSRVDGESKKILGSGNDDCLSCGEPFGPFIFGHKPIYCFVCNKKFCHKCCSEFAATRMYRGQKRRAGSSTTSGRSDRDQAGAEAEVEEGRMICRVCCEKRELWKRSGAWFYNGLPPFIAIKCDDQDLPQTVPVNPTVDIQVPEIYRPPQASSFVSLSSSSDYSECETSSSSRHTHTHSRRKKRSNALWKRKVEVPLIKRIKLKKALEISQKWKSGVGGVGGERNKVDPAGSETSDPKSSRPGEPGRAAGGSLLQVRRRDLHLSMSSIESSAVDSDYDMMYYDGEGNGGSTSNMSASCDTLDSGANHGKKGKFGYLVFSLLYDEEKCVLQVKVIKARKLKAKDMIGSSDPYVKVHLVPGNKKSTKQRTKTVRRNVNPTFNETLIYSGIPRRDVMRKRVLLTVKDHDRIGNDDFLGEVEVPLSQLESGRPKYFDMELGRKKVIPEVEESEEDARDRGRVQVSLSYHPMQQLLEVRVPIVTGLVTSSSRRRNHVNAQVHAVLSVIGDEHVPRRTSSARSERRRSHKSAAASNLVFAESLRLYLPALARHDLNRCCLDVAVWDRDSFGRESLIGAVQFSVKGKGEQLNQWCNCSEVSGTTQEGWHHLTAVDDPRVASLLHENRK